MDVSWQPKRYLSAGVLRPNLKLHSFGRFITPENLQEFLRLPDKVVVNTGCTTGHAWFADVFHAAGCQSYIGSAGYPDGDAALFYALHFFYELHPCGKSLNEAHDLARSHNDETSLFTLY
jgi:hypothetical protein